MPAKARQDHLQSVARSRGLKLVLDRYSARATGQDRYFLRPIWDARRAVRALLRTRHDFSWAEEGGEPNAPR